MTVASLVQAEGRGDDMPKIARVIDNRLEIEPNPSAGFLQVDASVNYALDRPTVAVLTQDEIDSVADSPYNTYTQKGLPPTPIEAPGDDAIAAAAHPADGPWFFYVTTNLRTGETKFTDSYDEFLQFRTSCSSTARRSPTAADRLETAMRCAVLGDPIAPLAVAGPAPGRLRGAGPGLAVRRRAGVRGRPRRPRAGSRSRVARPLADHAAQAPGARARVEGHRPGAAGRGGQHPRARRRGGRLADNTDLPGAVAAVRERYDGPVTTGTVLGGRGDRRVDRPALCELGATSVRLLARVPERAGDAAAAIAAHPAGPTSRYSRWSGSGHR